MEPEMATRNSGEALAMPTKRKRLALDLRFNGEEWAKVARGLVPHNLDEKWFVFLEDDWLNFHRNNGVCIYRLRFVAEGDTHRCAEFWVNRDPTQYRSDGEDDCALVTWIIRALILGDEDAPFPKLRETEQQSVWERVADRCRAAWLRLRVKGPKGKTTTEWLNLSAKHWDLSRSEQGTILYMELGTEMSSAARSPAQLILDGYLTSGAPDWIMLRITDFDGAAGKQFIGLIASAVARARGSHVRIVIGERSERAVRDLLRATRMDTVVGDVYSSVEAALAAPDPTRVPSSS